MSDFVDQLRATAASALAPVDGELTVPGLAEPVRVLRDPWGVPSIDAGSLDDLWFAQGFVTAGERLFQLDLALRAASGRLSEVFADRTLGQDRLARVVGFRRAAARIARDYDDDSRRMMRRFREGAAAWLTRMPAKPVEYVLLDLEPELPEDEASWAATAVYLAWSLSGNAEKELLRTAIASELGSEAVRSLLPPLPGDDAPFRSSPAALRSGSSDGPEAAAPHPAVHLLEAMQDVAPVPGGEGSNAWVVAGRLTTTGAPLLANDPHLDATQPGAWLELHLRAPGYEARGVALPFAPGVVLGATPHHAWGVTNVTGDVQDLYLERLNDDRTAALHDDRWEPLTVHTEEIAVRGASEPTTVTVLESRHGPLLGSLPAGRDAGDIAPDVAYALRWTGHERSIRPWALVDAGRARSFEEFRDAVRGFECPGQNFVYADVGGTIGYQCTGTYPVRRRGDGTAPVPGWTSEHEWDGWIPFEDLPHETDPPRGFVVSANDRPAPPAGDRHPLGRDFHTPYRARRITARLVEAAPHHVDSTAALQNDTVSLPAREVVGLLGSIVADDPEAADALRLLRAWDGDMAPDSIAAGLYAVWVQEMARAAVGGRAFAQAYLAQRESFACQVLPATAGDDAHAALRALRIAVDRLGPDRDAWRWGRLHTLRLVHPLGRMPGLESLFVAAEVPLGGDEQTVQQGGFDGRGGFAPTVIPSWRAVWDLADLDGSVTVLPAGMSGDPASPHWNDQTELWARGRTKPAPVTWPAVQAAAVSAIRLSPG